MKDRRRRRIKIMLLLVVALALGGFLPVWKDCGKVACVRVGFWSKILYIRD